MGVLDAIEPHKALVYPVLSYQYDDPVSGFRVMKNLGRAATAPATLICGDGVTANTIPTQVTRRGVRKVSRDRGAGGAPRAAGRGEPGAIR